MKRDLTQKLQSLRIDRISVPTRRAPALAALGVTLMAALALVAYAKPTALLPLRQSVQVASAMLVAPGANARARLVATGYVSAEDATSISPSMSGVVSIVAVKEGARVHRGDVLYELDPRALQARLAGIRAQLAAADADAASARAALGQAMTVALRNRAMAERDLLPRNQAADGEANVTQMEQQLYAAEARQQATKAAVGSAELDLRMTRVLARSDGIVVGQLPARGEFVTPGFDAAKPRVVNLAKLRVLLDIPEGRAHLVGPGSACEIFLEAFPDVTLSGKLLHFGAEVNRAKGTVQAWVAFDSGETQVLPGMSARVQFLEDVRANEEASRGGAPAVAKVPSAAIVRRRGESGVFVVEEGRAHWREVVVDSETDAETFLRSGIGPGERVVLHPSDGLQSGERVKETR